MLIIGSKSKQAVSQTATASNSIAPNADLILLGVKDLDKGVAEWGRAKLKRLENRLAAFASVNARVFPAALAGKKILFVDYIDRKLLKACHAENLDLYFAKTVEGKLVGTEKEKAGIQINAWEESGEEYFILRENSLAELMANHIAEIAAKLSTQELKQFLTLYLGSPEEEGDLISITPVDGDEKLYSKVLFDLGSGVITTNREYSPIRFRSFIHPLGMIEGHANYALLALYLAGNVGRSIKELNGILAFLTQCWEEEDNYGMVMTNRQRLRHVRHFSAAVMKLESSTTLPFFHFTNYNTVEGIGWAGEVCSNQGLPFFFDKYGAKRIVAGQGIYGLYLGSVEDDQGNSVALRFITETGKEKKLPNRPWNSTAIVAEEGIPGTPGYRAYTASKMRVKAKDDAGDVLLLEEVGDKRFTVFTNKIFAVNGSGVGDVGSIPFSYSLNKSLRGTFNSINLKDEESLDSAAEAIRNDLAELTRKGVVLKAQDSKGFRNVYSFNGVPVLTFSGFNQDLIIDGSCEFEVKRTPTSESLLVSLSAKLAGSFHEIKFRGLGIKAVMKRTEMQLFNEAGRVNYEVHMGLECQKGFAWILPMFCEAMCDQNNEDDYAVLDVSKGIIEFPTKQLVVDLKADESLLTQWISDNTEEFMTEDYICRDEFEYLNSLQDFSNVIEWEIDPEDDEMVVVREKVTGIAGYFTGNVEVSTRPENSSVNQSYMTIEQLAGLAINAPAIAAYLA